MILLFIILFTNFISCKSIVFYERCANKYLILSSKPNHVDEEVGVEFQCKDTKNDFIQLRAVLLREQKKIGPIDVK